MPVFIFKYYVFEEQIEPGISYIIWKGMILISNLRPLISGNVTIETFCSQAEL
jgi:hypothetical protein